MELNLVTGLILALFCSSIVLASVGCLFWILLKDSQRRADACDKIGQLLKELDELETEEEQVARIARLIKVEEKDVILEFQKGRKLKKLGEYIAQVGVSSVPLRL